jgi:hypothetical protein
VPSIRLLANGLPARQARHLQPPRFMPSLLPTNKGAGPGEAPARRGNVLLMPEAAPIACGQGGAAS